MALVKDKWNMALSYESDNRPTSWHSLATIDFRLAKHYMYAIDCRLSLFRSYGKKRGKILIKKYDLTLEKIFVVVWKNKQNKKMVDVVGRITRFVEG